MLAGQSGGAVAQQLQIASRRSGTLHRLLNLPDLTGDVQDHHDLDNALAQGGAHPCLHKLARRAQAHPSATTLVNGKFKRVCTRVTLDELLEHCRETIKNQRPSNIVERAAINGQTVGENGEVVILHEYVMRLMVETRAPLFSSDITMLKECAAGIKRYQNKRPFSRAYLGPGKFVFP